MQLAQYSLLAIWLVAGGLSIFIPLMRWGASRNTYYASYGRYNEYEQQQRAYDEAQNGNNYMYQQYGQCKWYQFQCRRQAAKYSNYYYQQASGDNGMNFYAPTWYRMINGKMEGDERQREEMGAMNQGSSGTLRFIYVWSLILFLALLLFGAMVLYKRNTGGPTALFIMLIVFGQFAMLQLLLLGQGVIVTGGREMEESIYGWYGQLGVLMAYANFWYMIFCFGFAAFFGLMACCSRGDSRGTGDGQYKSSSFRTNATDNSMASSMRASAATAAGSVGSMWEKYTKKGSVNADASNSAMNDQSGTNYSCMDIGDHIADVTTGTESKKTSDGDSGLAL